MLMLSSYEKCPVPINQQPRNEYNSLRESYFFALTTLDSPKYLVESFKISFFLFIFIALFISSSIDMCHQTIYFLLICLIGSNLILILILLRTYLGWSYISKRLLSATIAYEESGWYDGEIWIKRPLELAQDRLIAEYTIKPILKRIQLSSQLIIIVILVSSLALSKIYVL
uniref:hypothetical protein n=1 Tax=Rhodaphanes brevistipitata TaxID=446136 RepID=UPI001FCD99C1|nr:hypothetical protein MW432_pgp069 [Rhodaphanes brevistipitata]UNJ18512.1 hypothetical protein [Rhodaphanes brevistipitata]